MPPPRHSRAPLAIPAKAGIQRIKRALRAPSGRSEGKADSHKLAPPPASAIMRMCAYRALFALDSRPCSSQGQALRGNGGYLPCQWCSSSGGSGFSEFLHSLFRRNDGKKPGRTDSRPLPGGEREKRPPPLAAPVALSLRERAGVRAKGNDGNKPLAPACAPRTRPARESPDGRLPVPPSSESPVSCVSPGPLLGIFLARSSCKCRMVNARPRLKPRNRTLPLWACAAGRGGGPSRS